MKCPEHTFVQDKLFAKTFVSAVIFIPFALFYQFISPFLLNESHLLPAATVECPAQQSSHQPTNEISSPSCSVTDSATPPPRTLPGKLTRMTPLQTHYRFAPVMHDLNQKHQRPVRHAQFIFTSSGFTFPMLVMLDQ